MILKNILLTSIKMLLIKQSYFIKWKCQIRFHSDSEQNVDHYNYIMYYHNYYIIWYRLIITTLSIYDSKN